MSESKIRREPKASTTPREREAEKVKYRRVIRALRTQAGADTREREAASIIKAWLRVACSPRRKRCPAGLRLHDRAKLWPKQGELIEMMYREGRKLAQGEAKKKGKK